MEDHSDTRTMMMNNLNRLPISDRVVLQKTWELQTANPYDSTIRRILPTLIRKWGVAGKEKYAEVKLRSMKEALEELWVKAQKEETFKIFLDFETFEKILFQSSIDYRGHYVHQFDVFLLGYYILNKILETDNPTAQKYTTSSNPNFTWMLAATFHDMGYPIEQIDTWFSAFLKTFLKVDAVYPIEIEKILTPVFFDYLTYISEKHYSLTIEPIAPSGHSPIRDWKFHSILQTNLRKKNHGVVSSLLLIHSFLTQEKIARSRHWFLNTFPCEILPACHAIALHSLEFEGEESEISLSRCPYAFLLVLCDALQDWQRSLGATDYSELRAIDFSFSGDIPAIKCDLQINMDKKIEEMNKLENKLKTDGLMLVEIKQTNGNKIWRLH